MEREGFAERRVRPMEREGFAERPMLRAPSCVALG
jgi:hypothetical protein